VKTYNASIRKTLLLVLASATSSQALTVINFDGTSGISGSSLGDIAFPNVVGSNVNYDGIGANDRRGLVLSISSTPLLAPSSNYTGPAVYGGYETIVYNVGSGNFINATRLVETAVDNVLLRAAFRNGGGFSGGVGSGFYMFLAGASGISFDATSSLSLTTGGQGGGLDIRWLVRDGGTYYISSTTFASSAGTTTSLVDPNSITWAVYDPSGAYLNLNQTTATFSAHTFTNITAAGVYFEDDTVTGDTSSIDILKFAVNAVPEPGTAIIFGAGFGFLGFVRRRGIR
jgi:hypothetical protein